MTIAKSVAIVIVTYDRLEYLKNLLGSISRATLCPETIVVIDNGGPDPAAEAVADAAHALDGCNLIYKRLEKNVGGSGGFHEGVKEALAQNSEWLWLMDDDVEVMPGGLTALLASSERFKCIHGRRVDFDGSPFSWQPYVSLWLGLPLPYVGNPFAKRPYFLTNCGCFEGMFIHRSVVEKIGLPDPRFFITWDDVVYGWLASQVTEVAYVDHFVLKRVRAQRQISLLVRHLNDSSDLSRFYVMRNRAYVELYLQEFGVRHKIGFRVGTFLTLCKELVRLVFVEHSLSGVKPLRDGMVAGRVLRADKTWKPMPPLT